MHSDPGPAGLAANKHSVTAPEPEGAFNIVSGAVNADVQHSANLNFEAATRARSGLLATEHSENAIDVPVRFPVARRRQSYFELDQRDLQAAVTFQQAGYSNELLKRRLHVSE